MKPKFYIHRLRDLYAEGCQSEIRIEAAGHRVYKNTTGVGSWCTNNGLSRGHVSEFLNGRRGPDTKILDALGLEWRVMRKRTPEGKET